jgi:multiple sugar transport system permease protein
MATTLDEATVARDANRRIRRSNNVAGWSFAGPSVIIVLGLSFIPMIWAAYLSLTNSNLLSAGHFIGFANYAALAKDPQLRQAFTNTFLLALMYLPIGRAAGHGVAILL